MNDVETRLRDLIEQCARVSGEPVEVWERAVREALVAYYSDGPEAEDARR